MPGLYRGATRVRQVYRGAERLQAVYFGPELIWTDATRRDDFEGARQTLQSYGWTDLGPETTYKLSRIDGKCRVDLTDQLFNIDWMSTSRARLPGLLDGDNGYLEIRVGSKGNGTPPLFSNATYTTDVLRRANNTGTSVSGVGWALRQSRLFIVRYVNGTRTEVVSLGSFAANDVLRMRQSGNLHTAYRNGRYVGEWNDSGATAFSGVNYRSVIVRGDASKKLLDMRRFSPSLDYVEAF